MKITGKSQSGPAKRAKHHPYDEDVVETFLVEAWYMQVRKDYGYHSTQDFANQTAANFRAKYPECDIVIRYGSTKTIFVARA